MKAVDRKKWLFEQIVRLRRAEREIPPNRDIVAVRASLERELGGSLSPSLAASLVGVSHTALARWIRSGDVPVVVSGDGRKAIPLRAVVELYDAAELARRPGGGRRHVLEHGLQVARRRAEALDPAALVPGEGTSEPHARALRRSLAYHRALAGRLDRAMADEALRTVWAWRSEGKIHEAWADCWEDLLVRPVDEIRAAISEDSADAADLRQSSPLVIRLSGPERRRIMEAIR